MAFKKYRLTVDDMGGPTFTQHWIKELGLPIQVTQIDIVQDMKRIADLFPRDGIPHKTSRRMAVSVGGVPDMHRRDAQVDKCGERWSLLRRPCRVRP